MKAAWQSLPKQPRAALQTSKNEQEKPPKGAIPKLIYRRSNYGPLCNALESRKTIFCLCAKERGTNNLVIW